MNATPATANIDQVLASLQKMGISTDGAMAPTPTMPASASASQAGGRRRKGSRKSRKGSRKSRKGGRKGHRKSRKQNRSRKNRK